jgi:hypothetical protein
MDPKSKKTVNVLGIALAIGLVLANINSIYGLLSTTLNFGNSGIIATANLGIYSDSQCLNKVTSINWGTLDPGISKNVTIYVNNTGNVPITLSLSTQDWTPQNVGTNLTLTWNYVTGTVIQPKQVTATILTLKVSQNIKGITSFSFNIVITGTEKSS